MEADEPRTNRLAALDALARENLDPLSVAECEARVIALQNEIDRTSAHAERARAHRSHADAIFRR